MPGFDSPRALAVISAFPVNTALTIATPIVRTGRDRIRFRFRLDRLVGSSGGALPHLAFASFRFPSDKYLTFFVANEDLDGFISSNIVDAQAITSFEKPPLGLQLGAWNDLRVDIEHIGTTDEFRLYVGDELLAKRREVADGSTTFQLGADVSVVSATVELAFDDVLVTTF